VRADGHKTSEGEVASAHENDDKTRQPDERFGAKGGPVLCPLSSLADEIERLTDAGSVGTDFEALERACRRVVLGDGAA